MNIRVYAKQSDFIHVVALHPRDTDEGYDVMGSWNLSVSVDGAKTVTLVTLPTLWMGTGDRFGIYCGEPQFITTPYNETRDTPGPTKVFYSRPMSLR